MLLCQYKKSFLFWLWHFRQKTYLFFGERRYMDFAQTYHFVFAKLLKIHKKLFSKSFLCPGLGRKPQFIIHTKKYGNAVLFNYRKWLELRSKPCFKRLLKKAPWKFAKLSRRIHSFILAKLLRFQRTFHEKSFVSGFGADAPTYNAHKKARQRRAF